MLGFFLNEVEVLLKDSQDNVPTGTVQKWKSLGSFKAHVAEIINTNATYQQQFSALSRYYVRFWDGPDVSYSNSRFKTNWKQQSLLLRPEGDAKRYGTNFRRDILIECIDLNQMHSATPPDETSSLYDIETITLKAEYTADGTTVSYFLGKYVPATVKVLVNNVELTRGVEFFELRDGIRLVSSPTPGADIKITGLGF